MGYYFFIGISYIVNETSEIILYCQWNSSEIILSIKPQWEYIVNKTPVRFSVDETPEVILLNQCNDIMMGGFFVTYKFVTYKFVTYKFVTYKFVTYKFVTMTNS